MRLNPFLDLGLSENSGGAVNDWNAFVPMQDQGPAESEAGDRQEQAQETTVAPTAQEGQQAGPVETQVGTTAESQTATTPVETQPASAQGATAAETKAEVPWNEAIKNVEASEVLKALGDKTAVMKALGISDFFIDMHNYYDTHGNVEAYLAAKAVDWDKISEDDLIRDEINRKDPDAPAGAKAKMLAMEMAKYNANPETDSPEDVEFAAYAKKKEADRIRAERKADQAKFTVPTKTPEEIEANDPVKIIEKFKADEAKAQSEHVRQSIETNNANEHTKKLVAEKRLLVDKDTYFAVKDLDTVLKLTTGELPLMSLFVDKQGTIDLNKWYKMVAYAADMDGYNATMRGQAATDKNLQDISEGNTQMSGESQSVHTKQSAFNELNSQGVTTRFY